MIRFKLKKGSCMTYPIEKRIFEKLTNLESPYKGKNSKGEARYCAICPACDNPIQLHGLYKQLRNTDRPYGSHYTKSIHHLAEYNQQAYDYCPYASHSYSNPVTEKDRKEVLTSYEMSIYNTIRDYFDLAVYVLQQSTGLHFSQSYLKNMLKGFVASEGYMYPWATIYNIPWMLRYIEGGRPLFGLSVKKDSELFHYLQTRKDVKLIPCNWSSQYYCISSNGKYLNLSMSFILHERNKPSYNEDVKESIIMSINSAGKDGLPKSVHKIKLEINEFRFPSLFQNPKYRNPKLIQIAKEVMPEMKERSSNGQIY